jgi:putative thiamine transport system ATP-binding protein
MTLLLENLHLTLNGMPLIAPFDLTIAAGEITTIMGPSGCGKSSLLAFIAGDLQPPLMGHGTVTLNGKDLRTLRPQQRRVGRLFQDDLLFPHLSVGENVMFGMPRGEKTARLEMMHKALERADIGGFEHRMPGTLSGGQRARVSLMRALMAKPDCMLLDEPFNKLDQELRVSLRRYVFEHLKARGIPSLLVTHDIADALEGRDILRIGRSGDIRRA